MKKTKKSKNFPTIGTGDILSPIKLEDIGSNGDPCFGKGYDLSTRECQSCGDSELCAIKFAGLIGKTRKELESENTYKDLENRIDMKAAKKYYRLQAKKGKERSEILDLLQKKFEITRKEARQIHKSFKNN